MCVHAAAHLKLKAHPQVDNLAEGLGATVQNVLDKGLKASPEVTRGEHWVCRQQCSALPLGHLSCPLAIGINQGGINHAEQLWPIQVTRGQRRKEGRAGHRHGTRRHHGTQLGARTSHLQPKATKLAHERCNKAHCLHHGLT